MSADQLIKVGSTVLVTQEDCGDGDPPTPPYEATVTGHDTANGRYELGDNISEPMEWCREINDGKPWEPGDDVKFNLASSVRSVNRAGPWLLLFQPEIPEGWTVGRIEVTPRGNIQLEIKPKIGGTS